MCPMFSEYFIKETFTWKNKGYISSYFFLLSQLNYI